MIPKPIEKDQTNMPETTNNAPIVASTKLTKNETITLALTATAIGFAGAAGFVLLHMVSSVTSTVDNLLLTLQKQDIIENLHIGK